MTSPPTCAMPLLTDAGAVRFIWDVKGFADFPLARGPRPAPQGRRISAPAGLPVAPGTAQTPPRRAASFDSTVAGCRGRLRRHRAAQPHLIAPSPAAGDSSDGTAPRSLI